MSRLIKRYDLVYSEHFGPGISIKPNGKFVEFTHLEAAQQRIAELEYDISQRDAIAANPGELFGGTLRSDGALWYPENRVKQHISAAGFLPRICHVCEPNNEMHCICPTAQPAAVPDNSYRARATQAEQEVARLREQLAKRPNYEWFVEPVRSHLGQSADTPPTHLGLQIKQLKQSRGRIDE